MESTRITDFATLQSYELRDKLLLQRFEAGVWNDYYTEVGDYLGQYLTKVIEWDMSASLEEYITPETPGNYLILIDAQAVYTPGASYTDSNIQIIIYPVSASSWAYVAEYTDASTGRCSVFNPIVNPGSPYGDLTEDLAITSGFTGDGTTRIQVRYVEVTPL